MSQRISSRFQASTAAEVCASYTCSDLVGYLLEQHGEDPPLEFLEVLLDRGMWADAIDFLAHGLPARDAVWWGCLAIRHASKGKLDEKTARALFRAGSWVVDPTDENRALAKTAASDIRDLSSPAHLVALAASQREKHAGKSISSAIGALANADSQEANQLMVRQVLMIGLTIADGKHTWE